MSISTALFKRRRDRDRDSEPGTSASCSTRRAGGGILLMARRSISRRRAGTAPPRRRPLATRREDRLSALSDDLLLLILRRLYRDHCNKGTIVMYKHLLPTIQRYDRLAMRSFAGYVKSFLEGPQRKVDRVNLEFLTTSNAGCMNSLIAEAIDAWGVDDLEVIAKPMYKRQEIHTFPSHGLCKEPRASRLQSLKLGRCLPPALDGYSALTKLVLQTMPRSMPAAAYEGIFTSCPQLNTLHLVSCGCTENGRLMNVVVDAPDSEIRELVVENCLFRCLQLRALPCLESLASLKSEVLFESTSFPCLRQWNLTMHLGVAMEPFCQYFAPLKLELHKFLRCIPDIRSLIIRFTGPDRWIVPSSSPSSFLPNLRRLLVADVPSSWDVTWPLVLLQMAPSLESLHIHIAPCEEKPGEEISWQPTKVQQNHLREFVVAGFEGTARQIYLVKFVVAVCTVLRHVAMFKNGHARYNGLWGWEMVTEQHSWTDEEKDNMLKQIMDGISSLTDPLELVLG